MGCPPAARPVGLSSLLARLLRAYSMAPRRAEHRSSVVDDRDRGISMIVNSDNDRVRDFAKQAHRYRDLTRSTCTGVRCHRAQIHTVLD